MLKIGCVSKPKGGKFKMLSLQSSNFSEFIFAYKEIKKAQKSFVYKYAKFGHWNFKGKKRVCKNRNFLKFKARELVA